MKILLIMIPFLVFGKSIKEYPYFELKTYFTDPVCETYAYNRPVYAVDGSLIYDRPSNVYCRPGDKKFNQFREGSPNKMLLDLINDFDVRSLFLAYLSFSESTIADALCRAAKRGVKITFILDMKAKSNPGKRKYLDQIMACGHRVQGLFRGQEGGIGFAHNKLIIADYYSQADKKKLVFGSGNMSSGTTLHHENWNLLTTSSSSYFYKNHLCLKQSMITARTRASFKVALQSCRNQIQAVEEYDLKSFFVPSDGKKAMNNIVSSIEASDSIYGAAHRFTHKRLVKALKFAAKNYKEVKFIFDDDILWSGLTGRGVAASMSSEYNGVMAITRAGADVRWMETNHSSFLLQHNKFLIFRGDKINAVHTGAGNFTKAAFYKNFENYYFITIPEYVENFTNHFKKMFYKMATPAYKLPGVFVKKNN